MAFHAEGEEVQEVVEVALPVGLGEGGEGEVLAGLLAGDAGGEAAVVDLARVDVKSAFLIGEGLPDVGREGVSGTLLVVGGLGAPLGGLGVVGGVDGDGVAG